MFSDFDHLADDRSEDSDVDLVALDDALDRLATMSQRQARTVELRYFGGLTVEEAAKELGSSTATISRDWKFAKAWLTKELAEGES